MKKLNLAEWEKKYVSNKIEQFNQKNHMFTRPSWDEDLNRQLDDWSFVGDALDVPGFRLQDQALRYACRRGTMMTIFNDSKPNPMPLTEKVMEVIKSGRAASSVTALAFQPPEGMKLEGVSTEGVTTMIKKVTRFFGADMVGICRFDRRFSFSHTHLPPVYSGSSGTIKTKEIPQEIPDEMKYAVVTVHEMDYDLIRYNPAYVANAATSIGYSQIALTNNYLTAFINSIGYKAIDCSTNDVVLSVPLAMLAGLGDISRMGILINQKYGPRVRVNVVLTDLPMLVDSPIDFGVTEFCDTCKICAKKCPSQSISYGDRTDIPNNISNAGGGLKWPINAETCRMYWGRMSRPCGLCLQVCPFNKPDTLFHQTVRWFTDHVRWGDALYVKMDEFFGYGKPKNADNFWEEWEPRRKYKFYE